MTHDRRAYHHGDLASSLIDAARTLMEEEGVDALSLRAITRRAGVSATAAVPHFGNLVGLRSALAATGYADLAARLESSVGEGARSGARCYLDYARTHPEMFTLMFRRTDLDFGFPALAQESARAFRALTTLALHKNGVEPSPALLAALWGKVHGLAVLSIQDNFSVFLNDTHTSLEALLEGALGIPV